MDSVAVIILGILCILLLTLVLTVLDDRLTIIIIPVIMILLFGCTITIIALLMVYIHYMIITGQASYIMIIHAFGFDCFLIISIVFRNNIIQTFRMY